MDPHLTSPKKGKLSKKKTKIIIPWGKFPDFISGKKDAIWASQAAPA
jgi:hypothetical protein